MCQDLARDYHYIIEVIDSPLFVLFIRINIFCSKNRKDSFIVNKENRLSISFLILWLGTKNDYIYSGICGQRSIYDIIYMSVTKTVSNNK